MLLKGNKRTVHTHFKKLLEKYSRDKCYLQHLLKIYERTQPFLSSLEYVDENMLILYCHAIYYQYFRIATSDIKVFCKMNNIRDNMLKKAIKEIKVYVDGHISIKWRVGLFTIQDPSRFIT